MKTLLTYAAGAALFALVSCGGSNDAANADATTNAAAETEKSGVAVNLTDGTYVIDAAASTIAWTGANITGSTHQGTLTVHKGIVNVVDQAVSNGFVAVDMNTMVCTDEGLDDEGKANLIGHLKSDDFFGVEQFPYARVELEGIKVKGDVAMGYGKIFVREIGQPINFPVNITVDGENIVVDAEFAFDRSKHDVKFRSGSFPDLFPDLGDKLINDEINMNVHIVASL